MVESRERAHLLIGAAAVCVTLLMFSSPIGAAASPGVHPGPMGYGDGVVAGGEADHAGAEAGGVERTADASFLDSQVDGVVVAIARQSDGRILIGGEFYGVAGQPRSRVARLDPDGTLDPSFGDALLDGSVQALAVQADGKVLVVGGFGSVAGNSRTYVARLNADGTPDLTFGNAALDGAVYDLALLADGDLLIGGDFTSVGGEPRQHVARLNSDGTLDAAFADPDVEGQVRSVTVQDDGQILIAGTFQNVGDQPRLRVARLDPDGSLDSTFADPNVNGQIDQVVVQADDQIVVAGQFTSVGGETRQRVARLDPDGTIDSSFGDPAVGDHVTAMAVQPDGKVVIGGTFTDVAGSARQRVARLLANGAIDATLGNPNVSYHVNAVGLEPGGNILIGGSFTSVDGESHQGVARLLPATTPPPGVLDATFGGDGKVETNLTAGEDYAADVAVQADGKMVVVGPVGGSGGRFGVVRYLANGALDPSFSGNGWAVTNFTNGSDVPLAVALAVDGRITVAGSTQSGRGALARYLPTGVLDPSFSGDGRTMTGPARGFVWLTSLRLQPDGRTVVAGEFGGNGGQFGVLRFLANGAPDLGFSGDGAATVNFDTDADWAYDLALRQDGAIMLAGLVHGNTNFPDVALARLKPNGTLDPTFSGDGRLIREFGTEPSVATAVQIQPDGKIVIAGQYGLGSAGVFLVGRLRAGGQLDSGFADHGRALIDFVSGSEDWAWDLDIHPGGRIAVAGVAAGGRGRFGVALLRGDGARVSGFGQSGRVTVNFTPQFDGAQAVSYLPDGRILTVGGSGGDPGRFALARLHA